MSKVKTKTKRFIKDFLKVINRPEMLVLPGQLAYFFVLAVIPTVTLITMGASFLNLSTDTIFNFLADAFSEDIASLLLSIDSHNGIGTIPIFIVIVLAYYIASNGASSIIVTSNAIYGIKNDSYFNRKIKSFIIIIILLFVFILMLLIPMFGDMILSILRDSTVNDSIINRISSIITMLQGPILWFMLFLFMKLIYTMAPDKKIKSSMVNFGAVFTSICWMLITYLYSYYINNIADFGALYGNLANIVILMLWFYFLAYIFTVGLALNYHKEEEIVIEKDVSNLEKK